MTGFRIVRARLEHLDILVPLFDAYRVFYGEPSDPAKAKFFLLDRISARESVIFIAVSHEDEGLGFTQLYPAFSSVSMQSLYILNDLYVADTHRKEGIGKALLRHAQHFCSESGCKGLSLETAVDNPARFLYEALGWEKDDQFFHYFWKSRSLS